MIRRVLPIACLLIALSTAVLGQDPGQWSLSSDVQGTTLSTGTAFKAALRAEIEPGWHLYALEQPEGGPIATTIKVTEGKPFEIAGAITTTPKPTTKTDPLFTGTDGKPLGTKFFTGS